MQTLWNCWRATPGAHTTTPIQRARLARLSLWAAVSWAAAAPVAMAVPVTVSAQMNSLRIETVGLNPAVRFNGLQIDGADVMEFDIPNGAVALTNGSFYPTAYIGFTLTTHSDLAEYNQTFSGQWIIRSIAPANNPLPEAQADEVQVARANGLSLPGLGTLRVYERTFCPIAGDTTCNHGSVELLGHFASLHLDAFSDPQGGAFIGASPVPEPASMVLLAAGIAVLAAGAGGLRRRCP